MCLWREKGGGGSEQYPSPFRWTLLLVFVFWLGSQSTKVKVQGSKQMAHHEYFVDNNLHKFRHDKVRVVKDVHNLVVDLRSRGEIMRRLGGSVLGVVLQ